MGPLPNCVLQEQGPWGRGALPSGSHQQTGGQLKGPGAGAEYATRAAGVPGVCGTGQCWVLPGLHFCVTDTELKPAKGRRKERNVTGNGDKCLCLWVRKDPLLKQKHKWKPSCCMSMISFKIPSIWVFPSWLSGLRTRLESMMMRV